MTRGSSLETRITYGTCKQCLKLQYEHLTCEMKMNKMGEFAINFKTLLCKTKNEKSCKGYLQFRMDHFWCENPFI